MMLRPTERYNRPICEAHRSYAVGSSLTPHAGLQTTNRLLAYGPPTTIYNRFVRWARRGIWENLFRELAGQGHASRSKFKTYWNECAARHHASVSVLPLVRIHVALVSGRSCFQQ